MASDLQPQLIDPSTGKPFSFAYDPPQDRPYDDFALPHVATFNAILEGASRTYWWDRFDESQLNSRSDALVMRRDAFLMGLLQERKLAVSSLKWHLEVDNELDPVQALVKDHLTKMLKATPYFQKAVISPLLEAIWYGRAGVQVVWEYRDIGGIRSLCVADSMPVNGDKIGFTMDHTPGILVHPTEADKLQEGAIGLTTLGYALILKGTWRNRFILHFHELEDPDFFDGEKAVAAHGIGVRDKLFWLDWLRRELLEWVYAFYERVGLGISVWFYEGGNPASEAEVKKQATDQSRRTNILIPLYKDKSGKGVGGLERIETPVQGADALKAIIEHIEEVQQRYVVGQSASSSSRDQGKLGGNSADFQQETKFQIKKFDANNLAETITGSDRKPGLVGTMKRWTFPQIGRSLPDFPVRFVFDIDAPDMANKVAAVTSLMTSGVPFIENEVRGLTGMSDPKPGDQTVGGMAATGMPPGQGDVPPGEEGDEGGGGPWKKEPGERGSKNKWVNTETGQIDYHPVPHQRDGKPKRYAEPKPKTTAGKNVEAVKKLLTQPGGMTLQEIGRWTGMPMGKIARVIEEMDQGGQLEMVPARGQARYRVKATAPTSAPGAPGQPADLSQLAGQVKQAGLLLPNTFGQPYNPSDPSVVGMHKVFVSDLHGATQKAHGLPLDQFKGQLLEANRAGHLTLLRDDMAGSHHPGAMQKSAASEIPYLNAAFHAVNVAAPSTAAPAKPAPPSPGPTSKPAKYHHRQAVKIAAAEAEPPEVGDQDRRAAGNFPKGHLWLHGLSISIEFPKGSERFGVNDETGREWSVKLDNHYGYINGFRKDKDGDSIDVFIGPSPRVEVAFVIDQYQTGTDAFDESKVMLGFETMKEAKEGYLQGSKGEGRFGDITAIGLQTLKNWLKRGDLKRAFKGQKVRLGK